jgi:hypothetical protein
LFTLKASSCKDMSTPGFVVEARVFRKKCGKFYATDFSPVIACASRCDRSERTRASFPSSDATTLMSKCAYTKRYAKCSFSKSRADK